MTHRTSNEADRWSPGRAASRPASVVVAVLVLLALASAPVSWAPGTGTGAAEATGVGQVSAPEWLPVRTTTGTAGGGELVVGCTYQSPGTCGGHHPYWAIDLAIDAGGIAVFAAGAGQVSLGSDPGGWGTYLIVDHGPFGKTLYGHLAAVTVSSGQWVDQNTQVGIVGNTGGTGGTFHLHFEYNDLIGFFGGSGSPNDPGELKACHGNTLVTYGGWQGLAYGRVVHSDGTSCANPVPDVAARYHPLVPARILDSRAGPTNVGPYSTPWGAGSGNARDVPIAGEGGVPADAEAVVLNVTVVNPTAASFLQLWPTDTIRPTYGSSLNFSPGQIVPNAVTVKIGNWGQVRLLNAVGSTDVVIDVSGYYRAGSDGAGFEPVTPARLLDSRAGPTTVGPFATPWGAGAAEARDVAIGGLGGVPADAAAVVLNVTVVNPTTDSFLQLWPTGSPQPVFGSSLNFSPGQIVPNAVTVKLGAGGAVRVLNASGSVDVVIDVSGYYTENGGAAFHAVLPDRLLDSRPVTRVGAYATPWNGGTGGIRPLQVAGRAGVPGGVSAVVLNITAVEPSADTFVQLWPSGVAQPVYGSSLNATAGQIIPNAATVGLGSQGDILVFNAAGSVDLVADVAGYFS